MLIDLPGARDPAAGNGAPLRRPGNASGGAAVGAASGRVRRTRIKRSELSTTRMELVDMPMAAAHGGTKPRAASGMAARL